MFEKRSYLIPCIIAAIMLFLALAPWPYGYYQLLRLVVCGVAVYIALMSYNCRKVWATYLFGFIAVLFNPLYPIHLSRELWQPIDVICGVLFILIAIVIIAPETSSVKNKELKGKQNV